MIPNSTAGLLIGKGGSFIKQIKEESGAFIQISQKRTDLSERIVSIEGENESRNKALKIVLKKMSEDPQHKSVSCLSYPSLLNDVNLNLSNEYSYGSNYNNHNVNISNGNILNL